MKAVEHAAQHESWFNHVESAWVDTGHLELASVVSRWCAVITASAQDQAVGILRKGRRAVRMR
jgi:hypothetical protein